MTPRRPRRGCRRGCAYGVATPGAYSAIPAWWSRDSWRSACWADLHTDAVAHLRRQVGRRGAVSVAACWALALALSASADSATGRNAMPGNAALVARPDAVGPTAADRAALARLQAATGYGLTTLQKAARVLAARGWIVLVRSGKNRLTVDERAELRRTGSTACRHRNVWACTNPLHLRAAVEPVDNPLRGKPCAASGCDLPTTRRVCGRSPVGLSKIFEAERASRTGAARPRPRRSHNADPRTMRLAGDLKARVYWLRRTPHQRIMPALDRFAKAGWSAADILRELDRTLARRGWEVPTGRVSTTRTGRQHRYPLRCPWGYLAMLLRTLEPTALVAEREHARAVRDSQARHQQLRRTGPECPHGEPAGYVPSPVKGVLACPLCRRTAHAIATSGERRHPANTNGPERDVA